MKRLALILLPILAFVLGAVAMAKWQDLRANRAPAARESALDGSRMFSPSASPRVDDDSSAQAFDASWPQDAPTPEQVMYAQSDLLDREAAHAGEGEPVCDRVRGRRRPERVPQRSRIFRRAVLAAFRCRGSRDRAGKQPCLAYHAPARHVEQPGKRVGRGRIEDGWQTGHPVVVLHDPWQRRPYAAGRHGTPAAGPDRRRR